jgi:hypothetical protein
MATWPPCDRLVAARSVPKRDAARRALQEYSSDDRGPDPRRTSAARNRQLPASAAQARRTRSGLRREDRRAEEAAKTHQARLSPSPGAVRDGHLRRHVSGRPDRRPRADDLPGPVPLAGAGHLCLVVRIHRALGRSRKPARPQASAGMDRVARGEGGCGRLGDAGQPGFHQGGCRIRSGGPEEAACPRAEEHSPAAQSGALRDERLCDCRGLLRQSANGACPANG